MNLFDLGPKESPKELFGREREIDELIRLIKARRWVAILGPRMVGKTSILKAAIPDLEKSKIRAIYVNLWGAKGTSGLLSALARGLNDNRSIVERMKDIAKRIDGVSIGPEGISISLSKKTMTTLWDLLEAIGNQDGTCVIALDEIQELAAISGSLLKVLANVFNTYPNVIFIFTGSKFGLMRTLLEPGSSSPLYGRSPARIYLQPFDKDIALQFLRKGFSEYCVPVADEALEEAVERLGGVPGWLTLYGNNVAIRKLSHKKALEETIAEGVKIVRDELEHFLEGRNRRAYIVALRIISTTARWSEIKRAVSIALASPVNDATILKIIENLKAAMLIHEVENAYQINDPMLRTLMLSGHMR